MSQDVVIDLTTYKDKMGSRIPEGRYRVVVEDAERDTSNAGNTMINVYLRVVEGAQQDATLVDRLTLTEKAMFRVVGFMQGIGLPTPRKRLNINLRQFIGKVVDVDVEDGDPYNGRVKSEVRGYLKVEGGNAAVGADAVDLDDIMAEDAPEDLVEEEAVEEQSAVDIEAEALAQRVAATKAAAAEKAPATKAAAAEKAPATTASAAPAAETASPWGNVTDDSIDLDALEL